MTQTNIIKAVNIVLGYLIEDHYTLHRLHTLIDCAVVFLIQCRSQNSMRETINSTWQCWLQNNKEHQYRIGILTEFNKTELPSKCYYILEYARQGLVKFTWITNSKELHKNAVWFRNTKQESLNIPQMQFCDISRTEFTEVINATIKWKAPGVDDTHNFSLKKFKIKNV